jgi:hypothetical protein
MGDQRALVQPLSDWLQVPPALEIALAGLTEDDLNLRGGPEGWSIREHVHHLVESNLAACTIVIAALGTGGCTFDLSWLNSDPAWMERTKYNRVAVATAMEVLSPVCRYAAALLGAAPEALRHEIKLLGAPGTEPYPMTVEQMIGLEVEHAQKHFRDIDDILKQRPR